MNGEVCSDHSTPKRRKATNAVRLFAPLLPVYPVAEDGFSGTVRNFRYVSSSIREDEGAFHLLWWERHGSGMVYYGVRPSSNGNWSHPSQQLTATQYFGCLIRLEK